MNEPLDKEDYPKPSDSDKAFFNKLEQYQKRSLYDSDRRLTIDDSGMRSDMKLGVWDYFAAYYLGSTKKFHLKYRLSDENWEFHFPFNFLSSPFVFVQLLMEGVNLLIACGLSTVIGNEAFLINRWVLIKVLIRVLVAPLFVLFQRLIH